MFVLPQCNLYLCDILTYRAGAFAHYSNQQIISMSIVLCTLIVVYKSRYFPLKGMVNDAPE